MKIKHIVFDGRGNEVASAEGMEDGMVELSYIPDGTISPEMADCIASIIERAAEDARVLRKDKKPL